MLPRTRQDFSFSSKRIPVAKIDSQYPVAVQANVLVCEATRQDFGHSAVRSNPIRDRARIDFALKVLRVPIRFRIWEILAHGWFREVNAPCGESFDARDRVPSAYRMGYRVQV